MGKRFQSFTEFYPYYLSEHLNPTCRKLHFAGTSLVLAIAVAMIATQQWWLGLLLPIAGYGFAWVGHFFIEKNRPASFKYRLWSFIADWKMWAKMLTGQMRIEIRKARGAA